MDFIVKVSLTKWMLENIIIIIFKIIFYLKIY